MASSSLKTGNNLGVWPRYVGRSWGLASCAADLQPDLQHLRRWWASWVKRAVNSDTFAVRVLHVIHLLMNVSYKLLYWLLHLTVGGLQQTYIKSVWANRLQYFALVQLLTQLEQHLHKTTPHLFCTLLPWATWLQTRHTSIRSSYTSFFLLSWKLTPSACEDRNQTVFWVKCFFQCQCIREDRQATFAQLGESGKQNILCLHPLVARFTNQEIKRSSQIFCI